MSDEQNLVVIQEVNVLEKKDVDGNLVERIKIVDGEIVERRTF